MLEFTRNRGASGARLLLGCFLLVGGACSDDSRTRPPIRDLGTGDTSADSATADSGADSSFEVGMLDMLPPVDPFDPVNGCGASATETQRLPGSLLLVFDESGSMNRAPGGGDAPPGGSRWDLATDAISSVVTSLPDGLNMGIMLFGSSCDVSPTPQVEVGPLGETRDAILAQLTGTPGGGQTPAMDASRAAWDYLRPLPIQGQRGIILVTDGNEEGCGNDSGDNPVFHGDARTNNLAFGITSFAVGLSTTNNLLSGLAFNGGTPRTPTCNAMCTLDGELCDSNADCPGGSCGIPFPVPIPIPDTCNGTPSTECCHYDVSSGSFQTQFEEALEDITETFLDSCVFELPASTVNTDLVNVGVTFEGEERQVLPRSTDATINSWNYPSSGATSIVIQGPVCDELLAGDATVEIVLGCPPIII
ncbi:MAG: VWA domain-containing protein [Myxococcota bacterium]